MILANTGDINLLKKGLRTAGAVILAVGSVWGIIVIWGGIQQKRNGLPGGTESIIDGIMIAGASILVGALFQAFNLGDFAMKPEW